MKKQKIGVKVEEFDGTYECVICSESVRGSDALHCAQCSSNPVHVVCVRGSPFAETCAQCSCKTMRPWTGRAGGGAPSSATIDLVAADASTHLTLLDAGLCDVFKERMAKEVDQKLNADEQRYTQMEHDLNGNLYLVPNNYIRWPIQLSTPGWHQDDREARKRWHDRAGPSDQSLDA